MDVRVQVGDTVGLAVGLGDGVKLGLAVLVGVGVKSERIVTGTSPVIVAPSWKLESWAVLWTMLSPGTELTLTQ